MTDCSMLLPFFDYTFSQLINIFLMYILSCITPHILSGNTLSKVVSDIAIFVLKRDVKLQLTNFKQGFCLIKRQQCRGDFSLEKFNVTLHCFCGSPIEMLADSMRGNPDIRATMNSDWRHTGKSRCHSPSEVPLPMGICTRPLNHCHKPRIGLTSHYQPVIL